MNARTRRPATDLITGRYWAAEGVIIAAGGAHQLGPQGLFVRTDEAPEVGEQLPFELAIGEQAPISGVVRVRTSVAPADSGDDRPAGMNVQFVHLADVAKAREILARILQPELSLDDEFFTRAPPSVAPPMSIEDELGIVDPIAARASDPAHQAHRRRLRRTVAMVVGGACLVVAAAAVQGMIGEAKASPRPGVALDQR